jgi:hypothetical protein
MIPCGGYFHAIPKNDFLYKTLQKLKKPDDLAPEREDLNGSAQLHASMLGRAKVCSEENSREWMNLDFRSAGKIRRGNNDAKLETSVWHRARESNPGPGLTCPGLQPGTGPGVRAGRQGTDYVSGGGPGRPPTPMSRFNERAIEPRRRKRARLPFCRGEFLIVGLRAGPRPPRA